MSRAAAWAALLALALGAAAAGPAPPPARPRVEERKMVMKHPEEKAAAGDLAMVLLPAPSSPLITFRIQFRVGAADDPEGQEGITALLAHVLGEGGTKDLTHKQIMDRLYPMAASIRAQPDREVTTFIGEVHKDHAQEFYRLFSGLLLRPRFDEADFRRVRDVLVAGIETNLRGNDDEELGKEALNWWIFQGQPYGRPIIGTVEGLQAVSMQDLKAHYARFFTRGNVVVGLAGGYAPGLLAAMQEDFEGLPAGAPKPAALPEPPPIHGIELLAVEKPTPTVAISIGAPLAVTRADPDFYALMVANSWLGEHRTFNGRLMNVMRKERGLNYGDYSYIEAFIQDGGSTFPLTDIPRHRQTFSIWIRPVARDNAPFAIRQAVRELSHLIDHGLTKAQFEETRTFLLNYSRLWAQSLSRRLGVLLDSRFYGTPPFIEHVQEVLPTLTVEEVNAAVKTNLTAKDLKIAVVTDAARGLIHALTSGEPTPIHYQTPTTSAALLEEDREVARFPLPINAATVRIVPAQTLFQE